MTELETTELFAIAASVARSLGRLTIKIDGTSRLVHWMPWTRAWRRWPSWSAATSQGCMSHRYASRRSNDGSSRRTQGHDLGQ